MHHHLSHAQLLWLAQNQATIKFRDTSKGIRVRIHIHHGETYGALCLHNHVPSKKSIREAVNQLITTINFFL